VYELTGPESLSLPRVAELLSQAVGHPVEEAVAGTTGFDGDLFALTFERVRAGSFAPVTDTLEQVTRRPARTLALADLSVLSVERPERLVDAASSRLVLT